MSDVPSPHNMDEPVDQAALYPGFSPVQGYVLIELLGEGGFGAVWRARGPGGVNVAMKFIPMSRGDNANELRAIHLMKEVRHSNLLGMSGVWEENGYIIVAMELADCTLLDRFREVQKQGETGIPREELLGYMQEAAKGIDYLNSQNIQHRDIKPQNLLLVGGAVKVADFGLAKLLQRSMTGHTGTMTPHYAAPEFFRGHTHNTSDQYSLAITYTLLRGGRLPFRGSPADVMLGHLTEQPDLTMLPPGEIPIVARALEKEPHNRWPTCKDFVKALIATDANHPVTAAAPVTHGVTTTVVHPTSPGARRRALAICLVATLIVLVLSVPVFLLFMYGGNGEDAPPVSGGVANTDETTPKIKSPDEDTKQKNLPPSTKTDSRPKGDEGKSSTKDGKPPTDGKKDRTTDGKSSNGKTTDGKAKDNTTGKAEVVKPPPPPPPQPRISLRPLDRVMLTGGESAIVPVRIDREHFEGPLTLELQRKPPAIKEATFGPVVLSKDGKRFESDLTLKADPDAAAGEWHLTLVASGRDVRTQTSLDLSVKARPRPPSLEISAIDDRVILTPGKPRAVKVRVKRTNYDGPVSVSFANLPEDVQRDDLTIPKGDDAHAVSLRIDRNDRPFFGKVTLSVTAGDATAKKDFELIVLGEFTNSIGMKFVLIPPGEYTMGSPSDEAERNADEFQRRVTIPRPFFMSKYEVTQAQYERVTDTNPSQFKDKTFYPERDRYPVDNVSWEDAVKFCRRLAEKPEEKGGPVYRLPKEAEWEYACRAGTKTPFHFGDVLTYQEANFDGSSPYPNVEKFRHERQKKPMPVGQFRPNAFGLYDMHGNIMEWCGDETDGKRIARGGCWEDPAHQCRSAVRKAFEPTYAAWCNGFRVVLEYSPEVVGR